MDSKTLEHMWCRVDKARKIQETIKEINDQIENVSAGDMRSIVFQYMTSSSVILSGKAIIQDIVAASVNVLINFRDQLQKELDEL